MNGPSASTRPSNAYAFLRTFPTCNVVTHGLLSHLESVETTKIGTHGRDCLQQRRLFIAVPGTTHGSLGCQKFWDFFDNIWSTAIRREQRTGGSGSEAARKKRLSIARLHVVLVRNTYEAITRLCYPPEA